MFDRKPRILLGVTVAKSLILMRGLPAHLAELGWDVHVVSSPGQELEHLIGIKGVTVHSLTMARNPSVFADLRSLGRWIALLRRVRPDLISVGTPKAGLIGGMAAWLVRAPRRVYILRGLRLETASGLSRSLLIAMERLAMSMAHVIVAVSPSLRAQALVLDLTSAEKIVVLGAGSSNGVDLKAFDPGRFELGQTQALRRKIGLSDSPPPVIGFVGRLTRDKGLETLAEARKVLEEAGIDHQLLIVGEEDADDDVELQRLRASGRPPIETGAVLDTSPYYHLMDVLCLPTLREGFPNVVLEAAASGIPSVTTDATGAVDSVIDGGTGLITRRGDAYAMAAALSDLLRDGHLRAKMGRAARQRVEEHFEQTAVWGRMADLYREQIMEISRGV